jgi:hypothetical protein
MPARRNETPVRNHAPNRQILVIARRKAPANKSIPSPLGERGLADGEQVMRKEIFGAVY